MDVNNSYDDSFAKTLINATKKVDYLLEHYPRARDSDKFLYLLYLRKFTRAMSFEGNFDDFAKYIMEKEVPMPETIRRVRAKIQENGNWRGELYEKRHAKDKPVADWAVST